MLKQPIDQHYSFPLSYVPAATDDDAAQIVDRCGHPIAMLYWPGTKGLSVENEERATDQLGAQMVAFLNAAWATRAAIG